LIVTWVGGVLVERLLRPFTGELERFLIYLFVLSDQLGAVGFLVAAKSIFRFGELRDHANRLEAEYITIGTLLSFAWGLTASVLTRLLLQQVTP